MKFTSELLHQIEANLETGALAPPIYQTSTFVQEAPGVNKGFDYSRSNNPTRKCLEDLLASLEKGAGACAFSSGLAAVDAVLKTLKSGDKIIAVDDVYGGSFRAFTHVYKKFGIEVEYVDTSSIQTVEQALSDEVKLVWLESPTNPTLKISDISRIAQLCKCVGAKLVVDNTFASPVLQRPLELGADYVIQSATKYISGHSDVIAGAVIAKSDEDAAEIKFIQNATGAVLGPWDSYLLIRGLHTLELRVKQSCNTALALAEYLEQQDFVKQVNYPGLKSHPNHEIAKAQQGGYFGAVISFSFHEDTAESAKLFLAGLQRFKLAESLGGTKSLVCHPASMTHKSTPRSTRLNAGVNDSLVRLSIGIEDTECLIDDCKRGFAYFESRIVKDLVDGVC